MKPEQFIGMFLIALELTISVNAQMSPEKAQRLLDNSESHEQHNDYTTKLVKAKKYENLRPWVKVKLRKYASNVLKINDHLWWVCSDKEIKRLFKHAGTRYSDSTWRITRPIKRNSPRCIRLNDGATVYDDSLISNFEFDEQVDQLPGDVSLRSGEIEQVLTRGILVSAENYDDEPWYIQGTAHEDLADGDKITGVFRKLGTYAYTTVLGARKTVKKYEQVPVKFSVVPVRAEAKDVFKYINDGAGNTATLQRCRPRWKIKKRPEYSQTDTAPGPLVHIDRDIISKGEVGWVWRKVPLKVPLTHVVREKSKTSN